MSNVIQSIKQMDPVIRINVKIATIAIAIVVAIIATLVCISKSQEDLLYSEYTYNIQRENVELMYDGARADLVQCIDSTIRSYAPTTCMNGLEILRQCEEGNIDLFFVLAQGHIESHFGTKGMALKTNSVFNIFAYDGHDYQKINKKGKYKHPDLSLIPYIKLLNDKYLVDGKTEKDLMVNFVDVNGNRYASSKDYENNLTNMYNRYTSNKRLMNCYRSYTKYKILSGK